MVTFAAVSDIHMCNIDTPDADVLLVGGDMTFTGNGDELHWFAEWLLSQPQKHKVWICGNHELGIEKFPNAVEKICQFTYSIYLNDSMFEIEGLKIWGSPITPMFGHWAFMRNRGAEIRKHWKLIPENLDILITHGPPYGHLDELVSGEHVGCEELYDVIANKLEHPPRYHIFGHIHHAYGRKTIATSSQKNIELINLSICDESYKATNAVTLFELQRR